jgi:cell division protein FtsL
LQEVTDLAGKVALLSTATAASTVNIQKISDETGQLISWSEDVKGAGTLSKLFQIVTLLVLVLLLAGISYLAVRQYQINHHLHTAEAAVAETIKIQQKQIAEYDKHFADLVGSELRKEREASIKASVQDRLNRLRNGLAEQQLYRKNNGDWFVVSGKNEVPVADPDIIQELNQAFVRSGRVLITPYLVPPHKVVSFLRPNGQGGTDIVVTKELAP